MTPEAAKVLAVADPPSVQPPAVRNPWVAAAASFLLPGAGQALNGEFWKGTLLLLVYFLIVPFGTLAFVHLGVICGWLSVVVFICRGSIRW